ncbi:hypothetical protein RJ641_036384 [Dillenia turbinata]|uniref:Uncharacterized protein n=1 Tax=Dillenia turbinata TaxID=194707 RepID=A0AAN8VFU7_9MAGN
MADTETKAVTIAVTKEEKSANPQNPFLSFLANFKFPFPQPKKQEKIVVVEESKTERHIAEKEDQKKPDVVTFPDSGRQSLPTPLKLEVDEAEQKNGSALLWQVYALGGFLLLQWAWAKWNQRRAKSSPPDDEQPPPTDD